MKNNVNNATNNAETLKKASVLKSTMVYNTEKTNFSYDEKVKMIVSVMSDKQKVKSLIGSLKQSTAFNAFLCLQDVNKKEDYTNLWDNLKESLKEKGFKLAGSPLHKCFSSIWYLKSEEKALFKELTEGKDAKDAFLSLSSFLKSKDVSFTLSVSRIKDALNGKTAETATESAETAETATESAETATESAETAETEESPIEQAIRLIRENVQSVTTEQANALIELLESRYLKAEKAA